MKNKRKKQSSMRLVSDTERRYNEQKKSNRIPKSLTVLVMNVVLMLFPLLICLVGIEISSYSGNSQTANRFQAYLDSFFASGNLLWFSLSVLALSKIEEMIFRQRAKKQCLGYNICNIVVCIVAVLFYWLFLLNISSSIADRIMRVASWIALAFFLSVTIVDLFRNRAEE